MCSSPNGWVGILVLSYPCLLHSLNPLLLTTRKTHYWQCPREIGSACSCELKARPPEISQDDTPTYELLENIYNGTTTYKVEDNGDLECSEGGQEGWDRGR